MRPELRGWAEQVAGLPGVGAAAYGVAAVLTALTGELETALRLGRAGLAAAPSPTHPSTGNCWRATSWSHWFSGRVEAAYDACRAAADAVAPDDTFTAAATQAMRAWMATAADPPAVMEHVAGARRLAAVLANPALDAWIGSCVRVAEFAAGHRCAGIATLQRAQSLAARASPFLQGDIAMSLATVAAVPNADLDPQVAYVDAIGRLHQLRAWTNLWVAVESLAAFWADVGRLEAAGVLLGYLDAHDHRFNRLAARRTRATGAVRAARRREVWMSHGANLDREQVITYALDQLEKIQGA